MLALISNNLASTFAQRGQFAKALPLARRSVAGYEKLTKEHPAVLDFAESVVMSGNTLGSVLTNLSSNAEARDVLLAARAAAERLVSSHPDVPLFLERLIESIGKLAQVESNLGRLDDALATLDGSSRRLRDAVARHPDSAEFRGAVWEHATIHAEILLKHGRPAEAAEVLDTLSGLQCPQATFCYNAACLYSRAAKLAAQDSRSGEASARAAPSRDAQAQGYADRAVVFLQRAVAIGFRQPRQIAADPDLDPLRSRLDFRLLVLDLNFPADPFGKAR